MVLGDVLDLETLWAGLGEAPGDSGVVQDWIGNRWPQGSFPVLPPEGWTGPSVPLDGDGFRAGAIEWASFAVALRFAESDGRDATLVEMGASQGPWCLSWIRAGLRLGLKQGMTALGLEAADGRAAAEAFWGAQDLTFSANQCDDDMVFVGDGWCFTWRRRAVALGGGIMQFPVIDVRTDNGAQAVRDVTDDHGPHREQYESVQAVDPLEIMRPFEYVHLAHLDVQGGEEEMLRAGIFEKTAGRLGVLSLGTHSRVAEGLAFRSLTEAGFQLLAEEPCEYLIGPGEPTLVKDGEQLWVSSEVQAFLNDTDLLAL